MVASLVEMLDAKGDALRAAAAGGGEVAGRWLLHAVYSGVAPLRHLLQTRQVHPERLYVELARLAGALCTFAADSTPRDLPAYDHDAPEACFAELERHIRAHLGVVVQAAAIAIPIALTAPSLHSGPVPDARCYGPARWILGVRAQNSATALALAAQVPTLFRVCSAKYVLEIARRGYPGLALAHLPTPPAAVGPRPDTAYFTVERKGPCWDTIQQTGQVGVHVPDSMYGVTGVELTVIPDA
jgi:type VI secretion system protein ImpJ